MFLQRNKIGKKSDLTQTHSISIIYGMNKLRTFLLKHNNFIAGLLIASFLVALPYAAEQFQATSAQDKKEEAEENLNNVESEIEEIEGQQEEVEAELAQVRGKLSNLLDQQKKLKIEIADTQVSIEQTQMDLEVAKEEEAKQYEAMKIRIRYMYENSTSDNVWMALLESDGITDFLNRMEYITKIHDADRELTEKYQEAVALVEEKEHQLFMKMDELLVKQETFLGQQMEIEEMIADLEVVQTEYAEALAVAEAQAAEYRSTIEKQNEIIRKEEEERRRKEEEERRRREEEERRKQEEEQKRQEEEANKNPSGSNDKPSNDTPPSNSQGVTGQDVVNFAMQYVGNPYVWGGNSLTNGCDCSGFVHLVYKHFGYNTVRYSMSFLYEGTAVSRADVRPGDIVVYAMKNGVGHVAIYAGNGKIVEAQSSKAGITANRSIDCREIVGIRRIIQ